MSSELNSKEISGTIQRFFLLEINILAAHALSKSKMISRRQGGDDPTCSGQTSGVYVYTLSKPMTPPGVPRHSRLCRNYHFVIPCKRSATRNPVFSVGSGCRLACPSGYSQAWRCLWRFLLLRHSLIRRGFLPGCVTNKDSALI